METNCVYLDTDTALARLRGNRTLLARMLKMFLANEDLDALEPTLQSGDYEKAGNVAHAVKGMTGNLAMTELFESSNALMVQLRTLEAPPEEMVTRYRDALAKTREHVQKTIEELSSQA
jgi:Hpt domain.